MQSQRPCSIFSRRSLISAMPCETGETREIGRQILATVKGFQGLIRLMVGRQTNYNYKYTHENSFLCFFKDFCQSQIGLWVWNPVGKNKLLLLQDDEDSHSQRNLSRNYSKIVSAFGHLQGELKWWDAQLLHMTSLVDKQVDCSPGKPNMCMYIKYIICL